MKRKSLLTFFIIATVMSLSTITALAATTNEDAIAASDAASNKFYGFLDSRTGDTSAAYYQDFAKEADQAAQQLGIAANQFSGRGLNGDEAAAVKNMRQATLDERDSLLAWSTAVKENDLQAADKATTQNNSAIADFNTAYDDYSRAQYFLTDSQYQRLYWIAFVATAALLIVNLLWLYTRNFCCKHKLTDIEKKRNGARKRTALLSIAPFTGAAITLLSYYFTIGGTYVIVWGAIVIGLAVYLQQLVKYLIAYRTKQAKS